MYVLPSEPQSGGAVLSSAYRLFRASFESMLVLAVIATAIAYLPLVGLAWSGVGDDPLALISIVFDPRFLAACLALALLCIVIYVAMLVRMEAFARGETLATGAALAAALRCFPRTLIASLLFIIAVCCGLIVIVPGLILMQSLMFYLPAIALDDKGSINSLTCSHQLVWGMWWRTATIWGAGLIISTLAVYAAAALGIIVAILPIDLRGVSVVEIGLQALVTIVVTPFMVALWLELYRDLKLRKAAAGPFDSRLEDGWR